MTTRSTLLAAAVVLVFLVAGTIGHDPWKPDEAYSFGLVLDMLSTYQVVTRTGSTYTASPELRELRRRNKLLEQENEILRRATAYFARDVLPK